MLCTCCGDGVPTLVTPAWCWCWCLLGLQDTESPVLACWVTVLQSTLSTVSMGPERTAWVLLTCYSKFSALWRTSGSSLSMAHRPRHPDFLMFTVRYSLASLVNFLPRGQELMQIGLWWLETLVQVSDFHRTSWAVKQRVSVNSKPEEKQQSGVRLLLSRKQEVEMDFSLGYQLANNGTETFINYESSALA